jgi:hypothetical protein
VRKRSKKARAKAKADARLVEARSRIASARDQLAPAVSGAVGTTKEKVQPVVESARDKVVDDLLPRIAEAATAAAAAAAAARDDAVESAQERATVAAANLPVNRRKRRRRRLALLTMVAAAGAAGFAALRSRRTAAEDVWTPADTGTSSPAVNGTSRPVEVPPAVATPVLPEDAPLDDEVVVETEVDEPSLDGVVAEDAAAETEEERDRS